MKNWILNVATGMLVTGYLIHALSYFVVGRERLAIAMLCFAVAMYFLFI